MRRRGNPSSAAFTRRGLGGDVSVLDVTVPWARGANRHHSEILKRGLDVGALEKNCPPYAVEFNQSASLPVRQGAAAHG